MTAITQDSTVTLHFTIKMKDGSVADSTHNMGKPAKLVIGDGSLSDNFEQCLLGLSAGESKAIELAAVDAFGLPNPDNIHHMDRAKLLVMQTLKSAPSWRLVVLMAWKFQVSLLKLLVIRSRLTLITL